MKKKEGKKKKKNRKNEKAKGHKKNIVVSNKFQRHKVFVLGEVVGETRVSKSEGGFFPWYPNP